MGNEQKNILEVACGTGRIAVPFALAGHKVTAFDIDEYQNCHTGRLMNLSLEKLRQV